RRARLGWRRSQKPSRRSLQRDRRPGRRRDRDGGVDPCRPTLHRDPSQERVRAAPPGGVARAARRQAGDADDGWAAHPRRRYGRYVLLSPVTAGTANGGNLADRLDGLPARTGITSLVTFTAIAVVTYIPSGNPGGRFDTRLHLAIVGAALIGATIGFLWYNAF